MQSVKIHDGWGEVDFYIFPDSPHLVRVSVQLLPSGPRIFLITEPRNTIGISRIWRIENAHKRVVIVYELMLNRDSYDADSLDEYAEWYVRFLDGVCAFLGILPSGPFTTMFSQFSFEQMAIYKTFADRRGRPAPLN